MVKKPIPDGWHDYSNVGTQIPGTSILPFKVPLKEDILSTKISTSSENYFTPKKLLELQPNVKLIVNLTDTPDGRYYNYSDFTSNGVKVEVIRVRGGGALPPQYLLDKFFGVVHTFMNTTLLSNPKALIGVHCTHGLNRSGYFICKYLTSIMKMPPADAIKMFETARGYSFVRQEYIADILKK